MTQQQPKPVRLRVEFPAASFTHDGAVPANWDQEDPFVGTEHEYVQQVLIREALAAAGVAFTVEWPEGPPEGWDETKQ